MRDRNRMMPNKINLTDILKRNPQIDLAGLKKSMDMLRELRGRSAVRGGYELVPPFAGKRVSTSRESEEDDPRAVQLRSAPD